MNYLSKIVGKIPKRFRSKKIIAAVIIIVISSIFLTRGGPDKKLIKTAIVEKKDIASQVSASGDVKSESSADLKFGTAGKLVWLNAKEGDFVTAGTALASLDKTQFEASLRQAQQDVNATDAILSQVYDEQKKQTQAENYDQKIRRTTAETNKNKAYDAMKKAEQDIRDSVLFAPIAGTITEANVITGEEVLPTTTIFKIADLENVYFSAEIDETEVGKINLGQESSVLLDAFENEPIQAQITYIAPSAMTTSTGSTAFEAKATIPNNSKYRIGLNGEIKITLQKNLDTLTVPSEAIIDDQFVWLQTGKGYSKKEIAKGIESDLDTEIISGLSAGDKIVISGMEQIGKKNNLQKLLPWIFK